MKNQITTATNLVGPDTAVDQTDARKYFNNFYSDQFQVGPADDAIVAFFETFTQNKKSARNLAAVVLYTALAQGMDPMTVLSEFQKLSPGELNDYLAAFLNTNRAPTSMIGIRRTNNTNPLISRIVLP